MNQLVLCSNNIKSLMPENESIKVINIEGVPITFGLIETDDLEFDPDSNQNNLKVLVKKRAFSANYRDKALLLLNNQLTSQDADDEKVVFIGLGSDFVADVVAVGKHVTDFKIGDRVINDGTYPLKGLFPQTPDYTGAAIGLPTNTASKEYEIFHQKKLVKIPNKVSDEIAATLTIGGITSYSMIRKLNLKKGDKVLVTAAKSNTSLFVFNALRKYEIEIYALSTSDSHKEKLKTLGVKDIIVVNPNSKNFLNDPGVIRFFDTHPEFRGFDAVIDPFFDLYFAKVIDIMAKGSKYTTCGLYDQHSSITGQSIPLQDKTMTDILTKVMLSNIQLIGNCLGEREDLETAIQDICDEKFNVIIDSVFTDNNVADFINRTYNAKDRWGKVVYKF